MLHSCQHSPFMLHWWQSCLYMLYTCCQDRSLKPALLSDCKTCTYACMNVITVVTFSMSQTLQGEALPPETADLMNTQC